MQRIIIEASNPTQMEHLLALLKQMDFVRNVWLEAANPVDDYVLAGPPMDRNELLDRVAQAEKEDNLGESIKDKNLTIDF